MGLVKALRRTLSCQVSDILHPEIVDQADLEEEE